MRVHIESCDTSHCDPHIIRRVRDGKTYYGLQMQFCECEGVTNNWVTFWATSLENLHVFTLVMQEKVESHLKGTPSEVLV